MKRTLMIAGALIATALVVVAWLVRDRIQIRWVDRDQAATGENAPVPSEHAGDGSHAAGNASASEESRVAVDVVPQQQARIGLRLATIEHQAVRQTIRAVGIVAADERRESHVHTRISGYIERIHVAAVGDRVVRGDVLYRVYSPDLVSTQYEYIASAGRGGLSAQLAEAALARLSLWGVPAGEIKRLQRTKNVQRTIAFVAPTSGFVIDKRALQGMYVTPEMELYHLADLSSVWVIVTLYEHELPAVLVGDRADIELPSAPERPIEGVISYIYPEVDPATRTARARIDVVNEDGRLKPGMYATATISKDLGQALVVPEDAVIDTGVRRIVFVQGEGTRFEPREVELGPPVQGGFVVRSGLEHGEQVVVRASFLIDAESRLQAALQGGEPQAGHQGHQ